jgi:4-hydroxy-tetrahydrodipicolinate reductase
MKIGIVGCAGRMGQMIVAEVNATPACELVGGTEAPGHPALGADVAARAGLEPCGLAIAEDTSSLFAEADAVIDFTLPEATVAHAGLAADAGTVLITGTTGLDAGQGAALARAAEQTAIVHAPNMSVGVNLLLALTKQVAGILGEDFDVEISEIHHRHKVDAPSGTALGLGQAAAAGRGIELDEAALRGRDGITGARPPGGIGFAVSRGGDVVGEHSVIFAGEGERVELVHKAASRVIFARGSVRAALWAEGKQAGLYTMLDVLGFD